MPKTAVQTATTFKPKPKTAPICPFLAILTAFLSSLVQLTSDGANDMLDSEFPNVEGKSPSELYDKGYEYYKQEEYYKSEKFFRLAAEQGHAIAQRCMGFLFDNGAGVGQDYKEAAKWYRLSAEQGDILSPYYLGLCYESGKGVEQNHTEALKWIRLSAERNFGNAQDWLKERGESY